MILPSKEFLQIFKKTEGALSVCESIAIMNIAVRAPEGWYIELGTYKGKSAMSAEISLKKGRFILVDPIFEDHLLASEVTARVSFLNREVGVMTLSEISTVAIQKYNDIYSYCFIDSGSHQDGLPMQEVKLLEDRIISGGIIAFHDYNSQFKEVKEAYDYLLSTDKYEEINIDWQEIIEYVKAKDLEKSNLSWHHNELEFPCFVGALKRK